MSGRQQLAHVPPVHADERDRPVAATPRHGAKRLAQEGGERRCRHLARGHRELGVLDAARAADMPVDRNVVRRIGEHQVDRLVAEQCRIVRVAPRVAADQLVAPEQPQVAAACHRVEGHCRDRIVGSRQGFRARLASVVEDEVDLGKAEPGQRHVEFEVDQPLQLDCEDLAVPAGVQRQLIVGNHICPPLGLGEVRQRHGWHRGQAEQPGRHHPTVPRDDLARVADQHRVSKPEPRDAVGDLPNLLLAVGSGVRSEWLQRRRRLVNDFVPSVFHRCVPPSVRPSPRLSFRQ